MAQTLQRLDTEFDRQLHNLLAKRYPHQAHVFEQEFIDLVEPLRDELKRHQIQFEYNVEQGTVPFVIVVSSEFVSTEDAMLSVGYNNKVGNVNLYPKEPEDFLTIESVIVPSNRAYLLLDIDRGKETLNLAPSEALPIIYSQERSPLTIDEGIALITHYPELLLKNNCFSLLASRIANDKRVPAIWINAAKQANLGWCWDGNPHTWLGSASCKKRA